MQTHHVVKVTLAPGGGPDAIRQAARAIHRLGRIAIIACEGDFLVFGVVLKREKGCLEELAEIPGVQAVTPVRAAYALGSREFRNSSTVVNVRGVRVGGGYL